MTSDHDPVESLEAAGIGVAWIRDMPNDVIWLPEDHIVVLNAQCSRGRLNIAIQDLVSPVE